MEKRQRSRFCIRCFLSGADGQKDTRLSGYNLREENRMKSTNELTIAVAGTGYVGLSVATLLAQHHKVYAVDIIPEKVELINRKQSPIQDDYIEKYLAEKELDLTATTDGEDAYKKADFVVIDRKSVV